MPSTKAQPTTMPAKTTTSYTTRTFAYSSRSGATTPDRHAHRSGTDAGQQHRDKSRSYSQSRPAMPSRSATSDSSASSEDDFSSVPPNAFGIMHEWELESLEKWQRRLLQVRKDQSVLRARIDVLKKQEESMWNSSRKPHPTSDKGNDYAEWAGLIASEIASLQTELALTMDSEDKAKKGIRKATSRLERLRAMEDRWKVPSPGATPPLSRATSPTPGPATASRPAKPQRQSSTSSSTSTGSSNSTPPTSSSSPKPTRKPSMRSFERPPAPKAPEPALKKPKPKKHPLQPTTRAASLDPWLAYEDKWHQLQTNPSGAPIQLRFASIPWPMLAQPTNVDEIRVSDIREFVLNPRAIRAAGLRKDHEKEGSSEERQRHVELKERRAMLRAAILRWHPDKFLSKFLGWIDEDERAVVKEGVGKVIRCLNEIMRIEDIRAKTL